jgi:hypothetical protein
MPPACPWDAPLRSQHGHGSSGGYSELPGHVTFGRPSEWRTICEPAFPSTLWPQASPPVAIVGAAASSALALGMFAVPPTLQASAAPMSIAACQQLLRGVLCTWQNSNDSGTQWNFPEFGSQQTMVTGNTSAMPQMTRSAHCITGPNRTFSSPRTARRTAIGHGSVCQAAPRTWRTTSGKTGPA